MGEYTYHNSIRPWAIYSDKPGSGGPRTPAEYWERVAACRATFGAKRSAKPHWQSQLRISEASQGESDTAPVQSQASVCGLHLPSPLTSFNNQLTGSQSRSRSPFSPTTVVLVTIPPAVCRVGCRCLCLYSLTRSLPFFWQTPHGFPDCTAGGHQTGLFENQ